jgi:hydrogenase large subunit
MVTRIVMDPITRLEGHLKIEISVDTVNGAQQVVDAWASGTMYRGFENLLTNRDPFDAPHFTQRICGVCPVAHSLASVSALDKAYAVSVPNNARIMRNLVLGSNFVQSHILHFYHLSAPDYIDGPDMPPWQPSWKADKRIDPTTTDLLVSHYVTALDMRRKAHEMGAIFGGRMPDPPAYLAGGFTTVPKAEMKTKFKTYLNELIGFIQDVYLPDVKALAAVYSDYGAIGVGRRNLLSFGVFDLETTGRTKLFKRGRVIGAQGSPQNLDTNAISEEVTYGWYADNTNHLNPAQGETVPQFPKNEAYSWLKAPRYLNEAYEVGPLARMWVNGDYRKGVSVMDRHLARAQETLKVAQAMSTWVEQLTPGQTAYKSFKRLSNSKGIGLTEAPRGAIGHWLEISAGKLAHYQILTPTCWNASPRDGAGVHGPMEEALIGTPVKDTKEPVEVLRVIHSFDPCLSCAVHIIRPGEGSVFTLQA